MKVTIPNILQLKSLLTKTLQEKPPEPSTTVELPSEFHKASEQRGDNFRKAEEFRSEILQKLEDHEKWLKSVSDRSDARYNRKRVPKLQGEKADFSGWDFSPERWGDSAEIIKDVFAGRNLRYVDFEGANISGLDFTDANCDETKFINVIAQNTIFTKVVFNNPIFWGGHFTDNNFQGSQFSYGTLRGGEFIRPDFTGFTENDGSVIKTIFHTTVYMPIMGTSPHLIPPETTSPAKLEDVKYDKHTDFTKLDLQGTLAMPERHAALARAAVIKNGRIISPKQEAMSYRAARPVVIMDDSLRTEIERQKEEHKNMPCAPIPIENRPKWKEIKQKNFKRRKSVHEERTKRGYITP